MPSSVSGRAKVNGMIIDGPRPSRHPGRSCVTHLHQPWTGSLSEADRRALIRAEISKVVAARPLHDNIGAFALLSEPLSVDAGTLTRSYKPRRAEIFKKYVKELAALERQLR